jgi:ABC-type lipoprotein export system ATPase subunit
MGLMRHLNQSRRVTFVIVTHDPGIGAQCDRIVRLRDGQIDRQHDDDATEVSMAAD